MTQLWPQLIAATALVNVTGGVPELVGSCGYVRSVEDLGVGLYRITLGASFNRYPGLGASVIGSSFGSATAVASGPDTIDVSTFDAAGAAADLSFAVFAVVQSSGDVLLNATLSDLLGAALLFDWETPPASSPLITLDGSDVLQVNDQGTLQRHMTWLWSSGGFDPGVVQPPQYAASGGPNDQPYVFYTLPRVIVPGMPYQAIGADVPEVSGQRIAFYSVQRGYGSTVGFYDLNLSLYPFYCYGSEPDTTMYLDGSPSGAPGFQELDAGPTADWHVYSSFYLASGCSGAVDYAPLAPNFVGSAAVLAPDCAIEWGYNEIGQIAFTCAALIDSNFARTDALTRAYLGWKYRLPA